MSTLSGKIVSVWMLKNSLEGHFDSIMIGGISLYVVHVIHGPDLSDWLMLIDVVNTGVIPVKSLVENRMDKRNRVAGYLHVAMGPLFLRGSTSLLQSTKLFCSSSNLVTSVFGGSSFFLLLTWRIMSRKFMNQRVQTIGSIQSRRWWRNFTSEIFSHCSSL